MAELPDEEALQKRLKDLNSSDWYDRKQAILACTGQQLKDERITAALLAIAKNYQIAEVREAAQMVLAGGPLAAPIPGPGKQLSRNEKIRDFLIGFFGWYLINGIVWALVFRESSPNTAGLEFLVPGLSCVLPANAIAVIGLAYIRRGIAFGALAAFAVNLILALILGLFYNAFCFVPFFMPPPY